MVQIDNEMRTFVAIELPEPVRFFLGSTSDELRNIGADVKWVEPNNIHLTLKFMGNVRLNALDTIQRELSKDFQEQGLLDLKADGLGVFPNLRKPRVIWAGVRDKSAALGQLAERIDSCLARLGFEPEHRQFNAHLTLGRVRSNVRIGPLLDAIKKNEAVSGPHFAADHAVLFQSELTPRGAIYRPLFRFDFQGA